MRTIKYWIASLKTRYRDRILEHSFIVNTINLVWERFSFHLKDTVDSTVDINETPGEKT